MIVDPSCTINSKHHLPYCTVRYRTYHAYLRKKPVDKIVTSVNLSFTEHLLVTVMKVGTDTYLGTGIVRRYRYLPYSFLCFSGIVQS